MRREFSWLLVGLLLFPMGARAATWIVDDDGGPGVDFTSIQAALDQAAEGDTVFVHNGTYHEGKVASWSANYAGVLIFDCSVRLIGESVDGVVVYSNLPQPQVGRTSALLFSATPAASAYCTEIRNLTLIHTQPGTELGSSGTYAYTALTHGGNAYNVIRGESLIQNVVFRLPADHPKALLYANSSQFKNTFRNLTVDFGTVHSGNISYVNYVHPDTELRNSILVNTTGNSVYGGSSRSGPIIAVAYSTLVGPTTAPVGPENSVADPLFVDRASANYHLSVGSPAIASGDPSATYANPNGTRTDRGAYGSWRGPGTTCSGEPVVLPPTEEGQPPPPPELTIGGGDCIIDPADPAWCTLTLTGNSGHSCGITVVGGGQPPDSFESSGPFTRLYRRRVSDSGGLTVTASNSGGTETLALPVVAVPPAPTLLSGPGDGSSYTSGQPLTWELSSLASIEAEVEVQVDFGEGPVSYGTFPASQSGQVDITLTLSPCGCQPRILFLPYLSGQVVHYGPGTVIELVEEPAPPATYRLNDYNVFVLGDYTGGTEVQGKVAAGGDLHMQHFSVGAGLDPSDVDNVLVAGGNLSLQYGGLFGKASYGGTATVDGTVTFERGSLTQGTSLDFAAAGIALRQLSATLHAQPVNGVTHLEAWGGLFLEGTDDALNVFQVDASVFASTCYLSISAPAQSLVVLNIVGTSATFSGFSTGFSGGIDATGVLFNFVDATGITLSHHGFFGTMLAPQAHVKFSDGSFDGGIYAGSMSGNAEGHLRPLREIHLGPSP